MELDPVSEAIDLCRDAGIAPHFVVILDPAADRETMAEQLRRAIAEPASAEPRVVHVPAAEADEMANEIRRFELLSGLTAPVPFAIARTGPAERPRAVIDLDAPVPAGARPLGSLLLASPA